MRYFRGILVFAVLICTVSIALADGIPDPRIVIGGDYASTPVYGANFSFTSNSLGGGYYGDYPQNYGPGGFVNVSNADWTSLVITVPTPTDNSGAYITAREAYDVDAYTARIFRFWDIQFSGDNSLLTILFWGTGFYISGETGIFYTGIPTEAGEEYLAAAHFSINLNDEGTNPDGSGGWKRGDQGLAFSATANAIPEPATFSLLLGGVIALGVRVAWGKRTRRVSN
jgi:hypothetical protein